ncbi:MAG: hypothetical protein ACLT9W_06000 [Streptococcus sp.]
MDSRLKFTKIDYARLMQGNYGIGEYISKYVKRLILTLEDGSQRNSAGNRQRWQWAIDLSKYGTVVGWRME